MKFLFLLQFVFFSFNLDAQVDTTYHYETNEIRSISFQPNIFGIYKTNFYYKTGEINVENSLNKKNINIKSKSCFKNGNIKRLYTKASKKTIDYYKSGALKSIRKKTKNLIFSKEYYENGFKSRVYRNIGERVTCEYSNTLDDGMIDINSYTCILNNIEVISKDGNYFDLDGNKIRLKARAKNIEWFENGKLKNISKGNKTMIIRKEWNESGELILDEKIER